MMMDEQRTNFFHHCDFILIDLTPVHLPAKSGSPDIYLFIPLALDKFGEILVVEIFVLDFLTEARTN